MGEACRVREMPQKCNWHNLDIFTGVDGRGCPMAHGDLRLYLGGSESWGMGFGSSPFILGALVGIWGPGVSAGVVVSIAYY